MFLRHTFSIILINTAHAQGCNNPDGCDTVRTFSVAIGNTLLLSLGSFPLPLVSSSDYYHVNTSVVGTSALA